jgi:hypothetical protein
VDPPSAEGATGVAGVVVNVPLHPPLAVVVRSHAAKEASMAAWVWLAASVLSVPQVNVTDGAVSTVNLLVQAVINGTQLFV